MSKFFVNQEDIYPDHINITGDDVAHIKKVLRLRCGDKIIIGDGAGFDYAAEITAIEQGFVRAAIVEKSASNTEPPVDITLFQGLPKADKMEIIIQKCVELGVKKIVPVITERTVVRLDGKKDAANKVARWQRIALEAAKQCNRGIVPQVDFPVTFGHSFGLMSDTELALLPYEMEKNNRLKSVIKQDIKKVAVMIGPEGGFTEEEVQKAVVWGMKPVSLGPRILRTETAGLAVLSILMYELGDVGK